MKPSTDHLSAAFAGIMRAILQDVLEEHRVAIRADLRRALAETTAAKRRPEAAAFDTRTAATYLSVSPRTLARMRKDGRLTAVRVGKQVRFRREDLDAILSASE
jgi:excisionase family DNA binding protein